VSGIREPEAVLRRNLRALRITSEKLKLGTDKLFGNMAIELKGEEVI